MELFKLVPQMVMDVISRVIPGIVALITISIATDIRLGKVANDFLDGSTALQGSAILIVLGLTIIAYIFGQMIAPLSDFVESRLVKFILPKYYTILKDAIGSKSEYPSPVRKFLIWELGYQAEQDTDKINAVQCSNAIFVWYDWLRVNKPEIGTKAAKIRSEYRMHSQNAISFLISVTVHLVFVGIGLIGFKVYFVIVMLLSILACLWATARTNRTFQWLIINQYYSAKFSGVDDKSQKL